MTRPILALLIPFLLACTMSAIPAALSASTPTIAPAPLPTDAQQQATVTANALHIRSKPNYTAALVWYLKRGDVVTVTGECVDGWVAVRFGDVAGWVNASFLDGEVCPK